MMTRSRYTANWIDGTVGKGGHTYANRDGFCLETQAFPNSINTPNFPSVSLNRLLDESPWLQLTSECQRF
jgi:galactose mutarotase-like enzyme